MSKIQERRTGIVRRFPEFPQRQRLKLLQPLFSFFHQQRNQYIHINGFRKQRTGTSFQDTSLAGITDELTHGNNAHLMPITFIIKPPAEIIDIYARQPEIQQNLQHMPARLKDFWK